MSAAVVTRVSTRPIVLRDKLGCVASETRATVLEVQRGATQTTLVNLTPHAIVLRDADGADHVVPPSGTVARVTAHPGALSDIGLPVPVASRTMYGAVEGLPVDRVGAWDCRPEVLYIVSALVGAAVSHQKRDDVVCPGTGPNDGAIRDEAGRIVAVTRLVRP